MLPKGTVHFQVTLKTTYEGILTDEGGIECSHEDISSPIALHEQLSNLSLAPGTSVTFKIVENKKTDEKSAVEVKELKAGQSGPPYDDDEADESILRGTVILKKDSYGFIESEDHSKETFFHYSELSVKPEDIQVRPGHMFSI